MKSTILICVSSFLLFGCSSAIKSSGLNGAAAATNEKGMDRDAVLAAIRAERKQIQACYENELKKDKSLSGVVQLKWMIRDKGIADRASVVRSDFKNDDLHTCMIDVLSNIRYPNPPEGVLGMVSIPFTFGE